jgi:hypothetical protein
MCGSAFFTTCGADERGGSGGAAAGAREKGGRGGAGLKDRRRMGSVEAGRTNSLSDTHLSVELDDEAQHSVRRRVLRPKVLRAGRAGGAGDADGQGRDDGQKRSDDCVPI